MLHVLGKPQKIAVVIRDCVAPEGPDVPGCNATYDRVASAIEKGCFYKCSEDDCNNHIFLGPLAASIIHN